MFNSIGFRVARATKKTVFVKGNSAEVTAKTALAVAGTLGNTHRTVTYLAGTKADLWSAINVRDTYI